MSKIKVDQIESADGVADITLNNDLASLTVTGTSTHGGNVTINKDTPSLYVDATANNQNIWFRDNGTNTFGIEVQPSATGGVYLSNRTEGGTYNIRTTPSGGSLTNQVVIGASGHIMASSGIVLGNGTSYSVNNNLDDYEEGTWTPTLNGTATYNTQVGNYTKIGNLCYIQCRIDVNTIGTGQTNRISGLPFTTAGEGAISAEALINLNITPSYINFRCAGDAIYAFYSSSSTWSSLTANPSYLKSGTIVELGGVYRTS